MALDDYRMLAPQRQIGEPSSLENVIAQAMMSKLSPEMMQGYYLQARGQRQRHAAELGAQQAVATTAGLLASDRTADYKLRGDFAAHPESVAMLMPAGFLPAPQANIANLHSSYNLLGQKAKADEAAARAVEARVGAGVLPTGTDQEGNVTGYTLGDPLQVRTTGMNNATTLTATGMNNDTQLGVAQLNNAGAGARTAATNARQASEGVLNRAQRIEAIRLAMSGRDLQNAEKAAVISGDKMVQLYEANPTNFRKTPAQRAADHAQLKKDARDTVFETFGAQQTTPALGAAVGASQLPAGTDPLAGVIDAAAGGNAASGLPPDPTAAGVVAPSPAAPATAPAATRTAVPPPTPAAKAAAVAAGGDPWAPLRAKIAAIGGIVIEENNRADKPMIRYRAKDGSEARMLP